MAKKLVFGRYDYAAFLSFMSYSACSIIIPMALVAISKSFNFPLDDGGLGQGGALQLGRSFIMVISMLGCGYLAGIIGVKKTMVTGLLTMGLSIILAALSPMYGLLFFFVACAGFGEGILEGYATPFVQNLHKNDEPGRYITFTHGFWSVGIFLAVLIAGYLLMIEVNWRLVVGFCGFLAMFPAILMMLKEKPNQQHYPELKNSVPFSVTWKRAIKIISIPRFWVFFASMIFAGGGEYCLTFWCASYIQTALKANAFVGGLATAIFAAGMIGGRLYFGANVREKNFKKLIVIVGFTGALIGMFFPHVQNLVLLIILLLFLGIASAPFWPTIQSFACNRMRVDDTMLFILLSCAGVPGCGIFTFLMGVVGDKIGFTESFYLVPICYVIMSLLILSENLWKSNLKK
ncbi:MAG: MFS transporter [Lentisphaeria bacterium]|nr:MFS transporter [Lentisphaeria bacterium]